jgi:hypothetical protein
MLCAMPVTVRIDGLGELLDQQFSVVSRGQLLDLGMKDNVMQWRVRAGGPWQALLPGVYLGLTGAPNLLQQEMAAWGRRFGRGRRLDVGCERVAGSGQFLARGRRLGRDRQLGRSAFD